MLTPEQIADGWIAHDGGPCPVPLDSRPGVMWGDGFVTLAGMQPAWVWTKHGDSWGHNEPFDRRIIAYRPENAGANEGG